MDEKGNYNRKESYQETDECVCGDYLTLYQGYFFTEDNIFEDNERDDEVLYLWLQSNPKFISKKVKSKTKSIDLGLTNELFKLFLLSSLEANCNARWY